MLVVVSFACKSSQSSQSIPRYDKTSEEILQREVAALFALGPNTVIEINEDEEEIYFSAEEMPLYDGKSVHEGVGSHVNRIITYPPHAQEKNIAGRVLVQFIVVEDGSLANVKILQSAHPILDAEALRVIKALPPKWTPGKNKGKPVKMKIVYPFNFKNLGIINKPS
jgi:protein TonB